MKTNLTTSHPQSSYGIPVLVVDGEAFGPGDTFRTTAGTVLAWETMPTPWQLDDEERDQVRAFLGPFLDDYNARIREWYPGFAPANGRPTQL
jgi:hypothetical protein